MLDHLGLGLDLDHLLGQLLDCLLDYLPALLYYLSHEP